MRGSDIRLMEIQEGRKIKIIVENFPKLQKECNLQIRNLNETEAGEIKKKSIPSHIVLKMQNIKDKEKVLKTSINF